MTHLLWLLFCFVGWIVISYGILLTLGALLDPVIEPVLDVLLKERTLPWQPKEKSRFPRSRQPGYVSTCDALGWLASILTIGFVLARALKLV